MNDPFHGEYEKRQHTRWLVSLAIFGALIALSISAVLVTRERKECENTFQPVGVLAGPR